MTDPHSLPGPHVGGGPVYGAANPAPYPPASAYPQPGPYPPGPYPPQTVVPTSGTAVAALILGIISILGGFFLIVPQIAAIILGHAATRETKDGRRGGHGMAIAALIMGYLVTGFTAVVATFMIMAALSTP